MTREEMWKAVCENDASFDGVFFYAVATTGIFCRPSCKSRLPRPENIRFFETAEEAQAAGFRPCKRCRSDLLLYQPLKELAEMAKTQIEETFQSPALLKEVLERLPVSGRRLAEIFRLEFGVTPQKYASQLRLREAEKRLRETGERVADIAYSVGFESLSAFYRLFHEKNGISPAAFARKCRRNEQGGKTMNPNQLYFNPGCALSIYKPEKEGQILEYLRRNHPHTTLHNVCCRHDPGLPAGSTIINVCAGCDRRFGSLYEGIDTISLWELLDAAEDFPFPDYGGAQMSVHDPCPVRERPAVHQAVRSLLRKMNISVVETAKHGGVSVCCGDSFHGILPPEDVRRKMQERADSMPCENVVVYCVSCIKAIHIGGKTPRHLVDLLFGESTEIQEARTDVWHEILERYITHIKQQKAQVSLCLSLFPIF